MAQNNTSPELAFVLVVGLTLDVDAIVGAAAQLGVSLDPLPQDKVGGPISFGLDTGVLFVMPIDAEHPDVAEMASGPLSIPEEILEAHQGHLIVTAVGIEGDAPTRDALMTKLTTAVIRGSDAVGAMLGRGMLIYRADLFAGLTDAAAAEGAFPIEVCVDITLARESEDRMSFLTHGMGRYAREEFYVTCDIEGSGALDFLLMLIRWMVADPDKKLPTGETLGRTNDERIEIQRVGNPTGAEDEVIRLDL